MPERKGPSDSTRPGSGRALIVHPSMPSVERAGRPGEARLAEAVGLAQAISLEVAGARCVRVTRPQPATLFGGGAADEIGAEVEMADADLVVVDGALSPVQQRNLERRWNAKVIDRTGLILEIFGERARTREGQLQVELAHLSYQRSRLVRSWTHLERQRGGAGFLGGPGERQIELDRRLIDERIVRLRKELAEVRRTRGLHRGARRRVPYPIVALVGYTNAGKSTLFNQLSQAHVFAEDMLFATLDPTMRQVDLGGGHKVILSDTVGFISDLPTHLVEAFRATLEEVEEADLILHVRDIAHPETDEQCDGVNAVLKDLGVDPDSDPRVIEVLNKTDLLDEASRALIRTGAAAAVSALSGDGCDRLRALLVRRLNANRRQVALSVDLTDGRTLAWLYREGEVLARRDDDSKAHVVVRLDPADVARLGSRTKVELAGEGAASHRPRRARSA